MAGIKGKTQTEKKETEESKWTETETMSAGGRKMPWGTALVSHTAAAGEKSLGTSHSHFHMQPLRHDMRSVSHDPTGIRKPIQTK